MRKVKPYVDPRQEKLWPDIDCVSTRKIGPTWKEGPTHSFFSDIFLDFLAESPVITLRDMEEMAIQLPPIMDIEEVVRQSMMDISYSFGNHDLRTEAVRLSMNTINFSDWPLDVDVRRPMQNIEVEER